MRKLRVALAALLVVASVSAWASRAEVVVATVSNVKIAIIVGPVEGSTSTYRSYADSEYAEAIKYTPNVVKVYSPDATWEAVQAAVDGASIVIYHGHGNGWPAPYPWDPTYTTRDGFGLNATAGNGDYNNKYYGEPYVRTLHLAPNALILLHNLCYASGNSEPGNPDPTEDVARQRVDNFGAGFLAGGARAVIADGHASAVGYLRRLFTYDETLLTTWRSQSNYHGNESWYASQRTASTSLVMDPDQPGAGYYRSIIGALDARTSDVTAISARSTVASTYVPLKPARLLDTRDGTGLAGPFQAGVPRTFQVTGRGGVPANAVGVTGVFTVTAQTAGGWAVIGPEPTAGATTSSINFPVGDDRANGVTVALGSGGTLSATYGAALGNTIELIFDVTGYFLPAPAPSPTPTPTTSATPLAVSPSPTPTPTGATFVALEPARILDSRSGTGLTGPFDAGVPRTFQVTGLGGVPANASAVTGILTVTEQTAGGWVHLGPVATATPSTSSINFPRGDDRAVGVTVALGTGGTLSAVYGGVTSARVQLLFDVTGYFVPDLTGARYTPLRPARILDTRWRIGLGDPFQAGIPRTFAVGGVGGVPAGALGVTGIVTVTAQSSGGWVVVAPVATTSGDTSTINFPVRDDRANGVTAALGSGGTLSATYGAPAGNVTALIFDVTGYFSRP